MSRIATTVIDGAATDGTSKNDPKDATRRIERYRRRCDRRVKSRQSRNARPPRPERYDARPPKRSSKRSKPTKTWIDRVDEGYWCPWWDFEDFWNWCLSTCGGCCFWSTDHPKDDDDHDTIRMTTALNPSLCRPYKSPLPMVTVHVEAIAIGPLDHLPQDHDDASEEAAVSSACRHALSWVGFIPQDPSSFVTLPCQYSVPGTRVASLERIEGPSLASATHTLAPEHLLVVPRDLDAADLAMVLAYDLPALDKLFFGKPHQHRYSLSALRGHLILIRSKLWTPELWAMVRAAVRAGARHVYVVWSIATSRMPRSPRLVRKVTLWQEEDIDLWRPQIEGRIHRVLDYRADDTDGKRLLSVLDPTQGQYIVCAPTMAASQNDPPADHLSWMACRMPFGWSRKKPVVHYYVPCADRDSEETRQLQRSDIQFLLALLSTRALRPEVDAFLVRMDSLDANMPQERILPALILEPWKAKELEGDE